MSTDNDGPENEIISQGNNNNNNNNDSVDFFFFVIVIFVFKNRFCNSSENRMIIIGTNLYNHSWDINDIIKSVQINN